MTNRDSKTLMTRRRLLLALLALLLLLGTWGWWAAQREKILVGMNRTEVEAILGPPAGRMLAVGNTPIEETVLVWKDRGIVIEFDEVERVRKVTRPPSLIDNIRRMIGI